MVGRGGVPGAAGSLWEAPGRPPDPAQGPDPSELFPLAPVNPPYGATIGQWMAKAWAEAQRGALVVCLVPARVDTAWWHVYAMRGDVRFLRGRLRFGGARAGAPFPSVVVVFRPPQRAREP